MEIRGKGRNNNEDKTSCETKLVSSNFLNFEMKNCKGRGRNVKGGKKYSFDFVKFEEIVGNYSTFTIENLFISENNAAVKFITSADT